MSKPVLLGIVLLVAIFGLVVWSSTGLREHRVEVCVSYGGGRVCRTASGASREAALKQAQDNACALLTSGVTGSIACGQTQPVSVRWLE